MKTIIFCLLGMVLSMSCSYKGALQTTDTQNKAILQDVAFSESNTLSRKGFADSERGKKCHRNPLKEACESDANTYCAAYVPAEPGTEAPPTPGDFEARHEKMKLLVDCLKENISQVSETCQEVIENMPDHPPGPPPHFAKHPGKLGPKPPPHGPCGGKSLLASCISDAQTLCGLELPVENEVDPMSHDERQERVEAVVSCLSAQLESVSPACQDAIESLPK